MIHSYQMIVMYACMGMLAALLVVLSAFILCKPLFRTARKVRRSGTLNVAIAMIAVAAFVVYGGTKPSNPGGGSGSGGGGSEQGGSGGGGSGQGGSGSGGSEQGGSGSGGGSEQGGSGSGGGSGGGGSGQGGSGSGGGSGQSGSGGSTIIDPVAPSDAPYLLYKIEDIVASNGSVPKNAASVYDGYLYGGNVVGSIQVKVSKPQYGKSKVTATILIAGEKKKSIKGTLDLSDGVVDASGLKLKLETYGMVGSYGSYMIDGARNVFASKNKDEVNVANRLAASWIGTVNVASGAGTFSVSIAKKGKTKVSGVLASGTKVSYTTQLLVGEHFYCVPVAWAKKSESLLFTLWLSKEESKAEVFGLGDAVAGKPGNLASGSAFHVNGDDPLWGGVSGFLPEFLPDGIAVQQSGAKWNVAKAGKISYKNGTFDISKAGENPSGLKLSYKAKDGTFKGSFKVYSLQNGKLKSVSANVNGVLVGSEACGTATIKKVGGVPMSIGVD